MTCKSNPCGKAWSELGELGIIDEVKNENQYEKLFQVFSTIEYNTKKYFLA